jgi:pimeloyl-ACP methyl ester carboxylesterase
MDRTTALTLPDGRSLDLYVVGPENAPPLVFHCGTPSSGIPSPDTLAAAEELGLRHVSWSRPGYGSSTRQPGHDVAAVAADTAAVLDHLGAPSCHVLGWSGGGPHALACGALLADRVRSVATIAGVAPYPAEGIDWTAGMGAENVEEFGAALAGPDALIGFMERAWPIYRAITGSGVADGLGDLIDEVDRGSLTGDFAAWLAEMVREGLRESYWGWFDDDMAFTRPWGFDLGSTRVPVHVWQGGHDRMVPFAHGAWLTSHIATAVPHLHPEHGHLSLAVDSIPRILGELIGG